MNNTNTFNNGGMPEMQFIPTPGAESIVTPPEESFDTQAMMGSMQQILSENLGQYVVCEFLIGTAATTKKEGVLYSVGRSFLVLFEEQTKTYVVCDIFSVKFVTFYMPNQRPGRRVMQQGRGY